MPNMFSNICSLEKQQKLGEYGKIRIFAPKRTRHTFHKNSTTRRDVVIFDKYKNYEYNY